jgi:hypothetical protein
LTTGVVDTGGKFNAGVVDTGVHTFSRICTDSGDRWCTLSRCEFSNKFDILLLGNQELGESWSWKEPEAKNLVILSL